MSARYLIRLDDIAPNMDWAKFDRLARAFDRYGIRPLIGVIPDNQDPQLRLFPESSIDFWTLMRSLQDRGWEIAQHGYQHVYVTQNSGLMGSNGLSEFAGLPFEEQLDKLRRGQDILAGHGLRFDTFMAPSHSFDHTTLQALKTLGFTTITDGFAPRPYLEDGLIFIPQLFEMPRPLPFGIQTFCLHLNLMSDGQLDRVERFIAEQRQNFLSFPEAKQLATAAPWNRIAGKLASTALRKVRSWKRRRRLKAA